MWLSDFLLDRDKQSDTSCASEWIRYVTNYVCLNVAKDTNKTVHLAHFLSVTDASTPGLSNITGILVCQTNIMGTVSTFSDLSGFRLTCS